MIGTITALFSVLTSGAGGGLMGGIFGLFKQAQERKERIEHAKIELDRDKMEYENAAAERDYNLMMLERGAELEVEKIQVESEAAAEMANQKALSRAQKTFDNLKTTSGMDNYRAMIRPTLALWAAILFTAFLGWSFWEFHSTIDAETGKSILLGLFGTLTFTLTSVVSFYYVSRSNTKPKL